MIAHRLARLALVTGLAFGVAACGGGGLIESVDPFTGVIVTGFGRPPGGGRAYRATIYVQDPALDARSLKIALQSQGGGSVAPETVRAVEDAILTRARQLRIRDSNL